jgi:anaerobic selenocysteine-containing dehydrogenase
MRSVPSYCRVCQALCGTIVHVEDDRIVRITGDAANPASRGYTCAKGRAAGTLHHDPGALRAPLLRRDSGLVVVEWDEWLDNLALGLQSIVDSDGPEAIAFYRATHYYYDAVGGTLANSLLAALGTPQVYSPQTIDMVAKVVVPDLMLGTPAMLELPDWERTRLVLLFGENLVESHGHSTAASDPVRRLRAVQDRGGHVVSIDPRATPTTRLSDLHLAPKPGSDAALVAALVRVALDDARDVDYLAAVVPHDATDELRRLVDAWTLPRAAEVAGVSLADLEKLAALVVNERRLSFHCGTGITMSRAANAVEWLGYALAIVTGSLDREGGTVFAPGLLFPREQAAPVPRVTSPGPRTRPDLGYKGREYPCAALADEVLAGHVRALVVVGGNPMRLFPNTTKLERALRRLDVLACFDVRETETTALASHVAAVADPFERWDMPIPNDRIFPVPYTMVTPPVVPVTGDRRTMGWVIARLAERLGVRLATAPPVPDVARLAGVDDETILHGLAAAARASWHEIRAAPSGVSHCGAPPPGWFVPQLLPPDGIDLVPAPLVAQWQEVERELDEHDGGSLSLINTRLASMSNSVPVGAAPGRLVMHPLDAAECGISAGQVVAVKSRDGEIEATVTLRNDIRPGAVALPPGCGAPNINALTSDVDIDPLTGMPRFTAIPVDVRAVGPAVP